ncbi:MAG: Jag N-terminal domain-containing protein, partial [Syntrophales bacterium]
MEGREIEGKSIDEAIANACSEFQVPREKLNIEIISEGTPGFLGMGAKKALIRASLLTIDMALDTPYVRREPKLPSGAAPVEPVRRPASPAPAASRPAAAPSDDEPAAEKAKRILEGILTRMQIESPVATEETEEAIILNIQGDGS